MKEKNQNLLKIVWLLFVILTGIQSAFSQDNEDIGSPIIENFRPSDYGAAGQNWGISQDARGVMYFANNLGMLTYSGGKAWDILDMSSLESIDFDSVNNVIYLGTENDFGYLDIQPNGKFKFVSLLKKHFRKKECTRVWSTICTPQGVFFHTSEMIFRVSQGKMKTWEAQTSFHRCFYLNNTIYLRQEGLGLFSINQDGLVFVDGSEIFADNRIDFMCSEGKDEYSIVSRDLGFYRMNEVQGKMKFNKIHAEADALLKNTLLYCGTKTSVGLYALGTLSSGLVLTDSKGNIKGKIDKQDGILGNIVSKVFEDKQGNLWLALDNGISKIEIARPVRCFYGSQNLGGNIENIIKVFDTYYVGSSLGLLKFDRKSKSFIQIESVSDYVFDLKILYPGSGKEILLLASEAGTFYSFNGSDFIQIDDRYCTRIMNYSLNSKGFFAAQENIITYYEYNGSKIQKLYEIKNLNATVKSLIDDDNGNLWVSLDKKGIAFVQLNNGSSALSKYHNIVFFDENNGLPRDMEEIQIINNQGELVFGTYSGLYSIENQKEFLTGGIEKLSRLKFIKYPKMTELFNKRKGWQVFRLSSDFKHNLWMGLSYNYTTNTFERGYAVKTASGKYLWNSIPLRFLNKQDVWRIYHENEKYTWMGLTDQLFRINQDATFNYKQPYNALINYVINLKDTILKGQFISEEKSKVCNGDLVSIRSLNQPAGQIKHFSYHVNDFTFEFSAAYFYSSQSMLYSTYLEGEDKQWSDWSSESIRNYMNLEPGEYVFHVKAKNIFGTQSNEATYKFIITPPWYQTIWAYILFTFTSVAVVFFIVRLSNKGLNNIIKKQTAELVIQKNEIEHKNKEITDSIYYAKRIQDAIMPGTEFFKSLFPKSFVLHRPKDIVSGDFYWAYGRENMAFVAAVDCTGHGVPGAFMSMMGNDYMNDIIIDSKINKPNEILDHMRSGIIKALKQKGEAGESKDGMDLSLINLNSSELKLSFAGANNPLYIVRKSDFEAPNIEVMNKNHYDDSAYCLYEIKGNKFPVGIHMGTELKPFTNHEIKLFKGDRIYLFSDGYADQFGGPNGKKLKYTQLKSFIIESMFLTPEEQKIYLEQKFDEWRGQLDQVDDVLVIGIEV